MRIIGVTACPTGIAHTYMAAEALETTARKLGHWIKVETQGSMGIENQLTPQEIKEADVLILAVDLSVANAERFSQKIQLKTGVSQAIKDPKAVIEQALALVDPDPTHQNSANEPNQVPGKEADSNSEEKGEKMKRKGLFGWLKN